MNNLKLQGVKVVHPPGLMYVDHRKWYKPMVKVFNRDADGRGVGRPEWPVIAIEGDDDFEVGGEGQGSGKNDGGMGDRFAVPGNGVMGAEKDVLVLQKEQKEQHRPRRAARRAARRSLHSFREKEQAGPGERQRAPTTWMMHSRRI